MLPSGLKLIRYNCYRPLFFDGSRKQLRDPLQVLVYTNNWNYYIFQSGPFHCSLCAVFSYLHIKYGQTVSVYVTTYTLWTRQTLYVYRNIEACLCKYCCSGKAINITYFECVFVALGTQHAMRVRHIVICGLPRLYNMFPNYLIKETIFQKKKKSYWTQNVCFDFLYNFCLKHFSFWEELTEIWS